MLKLSDFALWISVALLISIGLLMIFSTTYSLSDTSAVNLIYLQRQVISFVIGFFGMLFMAYLDYRHLRLAAPVLYLFMLGILLFVLFSGYTLFGAQRWLSIGPFSFQPSEISKFILIIVLASYFSYKTKKISGIKSLLSFLCLIGLPVLLIFKQPDLGTALVFIFISLGMLIFSEASIVSLAYFFTPLFSLGLSRFSFVWWGYIVILFLLFYIFRLKLLDFFVLMSTNLGVGLAFPHIWNSLQAYQQQRILSFLNPAADPLGAGYHTLQSKIAIGSGILFGKGFLAGTQTQLHFIPIQHSDFIFSAIGEELGFLGAAFVFLLFAVIIWRGISIAFEARDRFGAFLAAGVTLLLAFHFFINAGMVLGLLPVVGIPLPFVSFGGSFLVVCLLGVGLLQSISMRRQKIIF